MVQRSQTRRLADRKRVQLTGWRRQLALFGAVFAITCALVTAVSNLATGMTVAQIAFIVTVVLVMVRARD